MPATTHSCSCMLLMCCFCLGFVHCRVVHSGEVLVHKGTVRAQGLQVCLAALQRPGLTPMGTSQCKSPLICCFVSLLKGNWTEEAYCCLFCLFNLTGIQNGVLDTKTLFTVYPSFRMAKQSPFYFSSLLLGVGGFYKPLLDLKRETGSWNFGNAALQAWSHFRDLSYLPWW